MAAYPSIPIMPGAAEQDVENLIVQRAENGQPKVRLFSTPGSGRDFSIVHKCLTQTQRDTLRAHYQAHVGGPAFNFTSWDGSTYSVIYVAPPQFVPTGFVAGVMRYDAQVKLTLVS